MARYPLTFTGTWTYDFSNDYVSLATYKNTNSYAVKITKVELYLGTGRGSFTFGNPIYGNGNPIYNWIKIRNYADRSYIATSPDSESTGQIISKQVGSIYDASRDMYYPNQRDCALYSYTTFVNWDWSPKPIVQIEAGQTILIEISGGMFSSHGGVLCVDKDTRASYITVEPVNPNVTLTLKYNYSGAPNQGTYKTLSVPINNNTSLGTNPTRTGYSFDGWYTASTGGSKVNSPYKVTKNTTLYAHWSITSPTVTYYPNIDSQSETPFYTQSFEYASQASIISNTPARSGYIFTSWNTNPDGSGISYAPDNTFVMPASNIDLYAQWLDAPPLHTYNNGWSFTQDIIHRYDENAGEWIDIPMYIYNKGWVKVENTNGQ